MDETSLASLISFGRKNVATLCGGDLLEDNVNMDTDNINTVFFHAALVGKVRQGDLVKKYWYFNEGQLHGINLVNNSSSFANSISHIMSFGHSYPIKLSIEHNALNVSMEKKWSLQQSMLDLSENTLVQSSNWSRLMNGLKEFRVLKILDLSNNNIGRDACMALSSFLTEDDDTQLHRLITSLRYESETRCPIEAQCNQHLDTLAQSLLPDPPNGLSLTKLCLKRNQIDDECIAILCTGLQNNKTLTSLDLEYNFSITTTGWKCLVNLICNKTDINSTYCSNHTLQEVPKLSRDTLMTPELRSVFGELRDNLNINKRRGNHAAVARYKLWKTHFELGVFDLNPFVDIEGQVIPHVLAWFANKSERRACMRALYHFIRNWDVPSLFGFPSAESLRIGKRMEELEKLVESMRMEINVLKGGSDGSTDGPETLKRRRNI